MNRRYWFVIVFLFAGVVACKKEVIDSYFIGFQKPAYFPEPTYRFENNPVTKDGFELGRKLFYDNLLSSNNTISCGSCHIQTSAFTHHGHKTSHGIFDQLGIRNSPSIANIAWGKSFMWDGGVPDLDLQPIAPITSPVEMGDTMANVLRKLQNHQQYPALFKKAFGSDNISTANFLKALSQFMVMCISNNSKYDSVMRNEASFTADEAEGYTIFKQKCNDCHKEPLFTDESFRSNGLTLNAANDLGRYFITLNESDKFKFKVPSLRNLEYTTPYMHDGRIYTLEGVLNHYQTGIEPRQNLDPLLLQDPVRAGIRFLPEEKTKLIQFLNTLNDRYLLTNKMLSEQ
ncbi:MAG TPA: cytochrome c peroxidase [Ferruginibacter sp.]|nr:cytochrome c peroxidase [Ferruginibacter sp.]HPH89305.1 cytochrome c peroxidase [Ferruginibacter sp.]